MKQLESSDNLEALSEFDLETERIIRSLRLSDYLKELRKYWLFWPIIILVLTLHVGLILQLGWNGLIWALGCADKCHDKCHDQKNNIVA